MKRNKQSQVKTILVEEGPTPEEGWSSSHSPAHVLKEKENPHPKCHYSSHPSYSAGQWGEEYKAIPQQHPQGAHNSVAGRE